MEGLAPATSSSRLITYSGLIGLLYLLALRHGRLWQLWVFLFGLPIHPPPSPDQAAVPNRRQCRNPLAPTTAQGGDNGSDLVALSTPTSASAEYVIT